MAAEASSDQQYVQIPILAPPSKVTDKSGVAEVHAWLQSIGMSDSTSTTFKNEDIDGKALLKMEAIEFGQLPIKFACQKRIMAELAEVKEELLHFSTVPEEKKQQHKLVDSPTELFTGNVREFAHNDLLMMKQIGAGSFGTVFRAEWKGAPVCVKQLHSSAFDVRMLKNYIETKIVNILSPMLARVIGLCEPAPLLVVMESVSRGSLEGLIADATQRSHLEPWPVRLRIACDVAIALQVLHTSSIVHGNLNSSNVLVDNNWRAKVSDFEFPLEIEKRLRENTGMHKKLEWVSPELRVNPDPTLFTPMSDVFSLGVVLWEVWALQLPPHGIETTTIEGRSPREFTQEIYRCLNAPGDRPTATEVVQTLEIQVRALESVRQLPLPPAPVPMDVVTHSAVIPKSIIEQQPVVYIAAVPQTPIGNGRFGSVYLGKMGPATVAMKSLKGEKESAFLREGAIMRRVRHPNVVDYLGISVYNSVKWLVMEMADGTVQDLIKTTPLTIDNLLYFASSCATGMEFLGQLGIVHRDLAARNLLYFKTALAMDYVIKISDFGLAHSKDGITSSGEDTIPFRWSALEALQTGEFTPQSDVWSFGVLMWELVTHGQVPFANLDADQLVPALCNGIRLEKPLECPVEVYALMQECWHSDPKLRPTFKQLWSVRLPELRRQQEIVAAAAEALPQPPFVQLFRPSVPTIEEVVRMWRQTFKDQNEVPLDRIAPLVAPTILAFLQATPEFWLKPQSSAPPLPLKSVTLEAYQHVIGWFGAIYDTERAPQILDEMQKIISSAWFHKTIDSHEAAVMLIKMRTYLETIGSNMTKSFMVRVSYNDPWNYPFTISLIKEQGDPYHVRVGRADPVFRVQMAEEGPIEDFHSLPDFITSHLLNFGHPCQQIASKPTYRNPKGDPNVPR